MLYIGRDLHGDFRAIAGTITMQAHRYGENADPNRVRSSTPRSLKKSRRDDAVVPSLLVDKNEVYPGTNIVRPSSTTTFFLRPLAYDLFASSLEMFVNVLHFRWERYRMQSCHRHGVNPLRDT